MDCPSFFESNVIYRKSCNAFLRIILALIYGDFTSPCRNLEHSVLHTECDILGKELQWYAQGCPLAVKQGQLWASVQGYLFLHMLYTFILDMPWDFSVSVPFLNALTEVLAITGGTLMDPWQGLYHFFVYLFASRNLPEQDWEALFPLFFACTPTSQEYWSGLQRHFQTMSGSQFFLDYLVFDTDVSHGSKEYKDWMRRLRKRFFP